MRLLITLLALSSLTSPSEAGPLVSDSDSSCWQTYSSRPRRERRGPPAPPSLSPYSEWQTSSDSRPPTLLSSPTSATVCSGPVSTWGTSSAGGGQRGDREWRVISGPIYYVWLVSSFNKIKRIFFWFIFKSFSSHSDVVTSSLQWEVKYLPPRVVISPSHTPGHSRWCWELWRPSRHSRSHRGPQTRPWGPSGPPRTWRCPVQGGQCTECTRRFFWSCG